MYIDLGRPPWSTKLNGALFLIYYWWASLNFWPVGKHGRLQEYRSPIRARALFNVTSLPPFDTDGAGEKWKKWSKLREVFIYLCRFIWLSSVFTLIQVFNCRRSTIYRMSTNRKPMAVNIWWSDTRQIKLDNLIYICIGLRAKRANGCKRPWRPMSAMFQIRPSTFPTFKQNVYTNNRSSAHLTATYRTEQHSQTIFLKPNSASALADANNLLWNKPGTFPVW